MRPWRAAVTAMVLTAATLTWSSGIAAGAIDPQAPRDVRATAGDSGGIISVRWDAPSSPAGLVGYTIVTLDSAGDEVVSARTTAPSTSTGPVTVTGLTNGDEYRAVVYGRYVAGNVASSPSDVVILSLIHI